MFDLNLYPLSFAAGRELPDLPGLHAAAAPRRAERHRSGDLLAALLMPAGQKAASEASAEWFQVLSNTYFSTGGTVTAALRAALEELNTRLLGKAVAAGSIAVIRNQLVYLVTCGPARAFLIHKNAIQDFDDLTSGWPGLGASRTPALRFFQAELEPGSMLVLSADPPAAWTPDALREHHIPTPEVLRRRLLNLCSQDLAAGILHVQPGSGQIQRMRHNPEGRRPAQPGPDAAAPTLQPPAAAPVPPPQPGPAVEYTAPVPVQTSPPELPRRVTPISRPVFQPVPERPAAEAPAESPQPGNGRPLSSRVRSRQSETQPKASKPGLFARLFAPRPPKPETETVVLSAPAAPVPEESPVPQEIQRPAGKNWLKGLAALIRGTRAVQQSAGRGVSKVVPRVLPTPSNQPAAISPATMLFIAIAVPVIIGAAAVTVYYRKGASEERVAFLQQARIYAEQAGKQKDTALRRGSWEQTLYWVNKAEDYGTDDESTTLRQKAQVALDSIDGIVRMRLMPAFSSTLGNQVKIAGMAATSNDLYLLDSVAGRVLHMNLVGRSYEYDPNFNCGPGPSGSIIIGPLVGMATLPPGNEHNASVVAVDAAGNLLYCIQDEPPLAKSLKRPANNWGKITAMTIGSGNLYVLDVESNSVFRYDGDNYLYGGEPRFFFGDQVPNLNNVVDMTIYQDDLYLLRGDGTITLCTWSAFEFAPTRCTDPAPFGDARKSSEIKRFANTRFFQMKTTQPPDPSLYVVDSIAPAIYHFSLRLNLQRQLRQDPDSDFPLPDKPVTAMTISSTRTVFLAFGNQIYFGSLP